MDKEIKMKYKVKNQNGIIGVLYEEITDLSVGLIKDNRTDLIVKTDQFSERVELVPSLSGTYRTIHTHLNIWNII